MLKQWYRDEKKGKNVGSLEDGYSFVSPIELLRGDDEEEEEE